MLAELNEMFPTLYKRDSTGKVRVWCMELKGDSHRTIAGVKDGQLVTSNWTLCKPKNVGRSSETSAEEQALAEIEAQYKKKLSVDYFESENDIDQFKTFKPMLAVDWEKRKVKLNWDKLVDVMIQPKLDGVRCIATRFGLFSRNGKPIVAVPHIAKALEEFFKKYPNHVLDGELYNHILKNDFNKIISLVRKTKPKANDIEETSELVEYHIYDVADGESGDFKSRNEFLTSVFIDSGIALSRSSPLEIVSTELIEDIDSCNHMHGEYLEEGYEGSIIRLNSTYAKGKRSNNLIKRKDFDEDEGKIVGYVLGNGNFEGLPKVILVEMKSGLIAKATMTGSREFLKEFLNDFDTRHNGSEATVQYFGFTSDGELRFPTVKTIHDGKRSE